ncbi:MAG: HAD family hydrolase, partial [Vampirovibrionia bacterium]
FYKDKGIKIYYPDYLIALNGVKIYQKKNLPIKKFWKNNEWSGIIKPDWSKRACYEAFRATAKKVRFFSDYPAVVDVKYKVSPFHLELVFFYKKLDVIKQVLEEECQKRNTKVNIIVDYLEKKYVDLALKILDNIDLRKANIIRKMLDETGGVYVMMPCATSKGEAVDYLRESIGLSKSDVIAVGDGGNDYHLLTQGFKSIVLNNAHNTLLRKPIEELPEDKKDNIIFVPSEGSKGILEGMELFLNKPFSHCGDSGLSSVVNT